MFYNGCMERRIPVRELNQRTSAVLSDVARGVAVTITSDGRPIARLVPVTGASPTLDGLVGTGRAVGPSVGGPVSMPRTYGDERLDVAAALAADRADERW
jgi:prevent-host-death family protein